MQNELLTIGEAAKFLGVTEKTLRAWEVNGKIVPAERTEGGHRRYLASEIRKMVGEKGTIVDEYEDLIRVERNALKAQMEKKYEFMKEKGYVTGDSQDSKSLAVILSHYLEISSVIENDDDDEYFLKLIKMIWEKLLTRDLVSYQVLQGPTGLVFYMKDKIVDGEIWRSIESDAVVARTRKLNCKLLLPGSLREVEIPALDPDTFEPIRRKAISGCNLSDEVTLRLNSTSMAADIDDEIIMDLSNNSKMMGDWENIQSEQILANPNIRGIVTNEIGIEVLRMNKLTTIYTDEYESRFRKVGKVGAVNLYFHPKVDKVLLIRKGDSYMDSGYFFCPYMFLTMTPTILLGGRVHRGGLIRYGKKLISTSGQYYQHYNL